MAINAEESVGGGEGGSLVAINEWMVLGKALPQRRRFGDDIGIVACLRTEEGGFEEPKVTYTLGAAVAGDQVVMDRENFGAR